MIPKILNRGIEFLCLENINITVCPISGYLVEVYDVGIGWRAPYTRQFLNNAGLPGYSHKHTYVKLLKYEEPGGT